MYVDIRVSLTGDPQEFLQTVRPSMRNKIDGYIFPKQLQSVEEVQKLGFLLYSNQRLGVEALRKALDKKGIEVELRWHAIATGKQYYKAKRQDNENPKQKKKKTSAYHAYGDATTADHTRRAIKAATSKMASPHLHGLYQFY